MNLSRALAADPAEPARLALLVDPVADAAARLVAAVDALVAALPSAIPAGGLTASERPAGGQALAAAGGLAARWTVAAGQWTEDVAAHAEEVADGMRALADADEQAARTIRSTVPR